MRCVHINRVGDQCRDQALHGRQLCAYHADLLGDSSPWPKSRFPLIYRLAAGVLLLIFLIPLIQKLRYWLGF